MERGDGDALGAGGGRAGGGGGRQIGEDALALLAGGGGLSQTEIIQEQALTIAELEDKAVRATEYKKITKVRLKEAAQRLREYRLRAEALMAELDEVKRAMAAAEAERKALDRRRPARAATRTVAVQTEDKRKKTADAGVQTALAGPVEAPRARGRDQGAQTDQEADDSDPLELLLGQTTETISTSTAAVADTPDLLQPVAFDSANPPALPLPFTDATSAAIDAELAMSDSDDELVAVPAQPITSNVASQPSDTDKVDFDDEISSAIDEELEMSSDEEEQVPLQLNNAASAAVDAELATSDSEGEQEPSASAVSIIKFTAPLSDTRAHLLKSIDDEIDAELASSSDEEAEPRSQHSSDTRASKEATATETNRHSSSSSSDDGSSDSSDSSDDDGDKESNADDADGMAGEIEEALAGESPAASQTAGKQSNGIAETSLQLTGSDHNNGTSALAMALRRAVLTDERDRPSTIVENKSSGNRPSSSKAEADEIEEMPQEDVTLTEPATQKDVTPDSDESAVQVASSSRKRSIDGMDRGASAITVTATAGEPVVKKQKVVDNEPVGPESLNESVHLDTATPSGHDADKAKEEPRRTGAQTSQPTKKRDTYLLKARQAFKREIMRVDGEELDEKYLARTFAALVRCSATFFASHPQHVTSLCTAVTKLYRDNNVSPMLALKGALRVFRTPRTRNVLKNESMRLGELCQRVLLLLMNPSETATEAFTADASAYWELNQCLDVLRGLLMDERLPLENSSVAGTDAASQLRIVSEWSSRTDSTTTSHDKAFLVHVCALHAQLCRATGLLHRSRVFLFDVVRLNANIKGLQLAAIMVEVSPELLATELDQKFRERQMVLKDAVLHVLMVIAGYASLKQQELFNETGVEIMHRISRAIQREDLDEFDGAYPTFQRVFIKNLSRQVFAAPDAVMASAEASFQLGKSFELLAAFHGGHYLAVEFPLSQFRELFRDHDVASNHIGKEWATSIAGYLASTMASSRDGEAIKYMEEAAGWFSELLSIRSTEESRNWQLSCATGCVDIALNASALEVSTRRQSVQAVLRWFDLQPTEWLMQLPALFVRRLRSAVLTTRPPLPFHQSVSTK